MGAQEVVTYQLAGLGLRNLLAIGHPPSCIHVERRSVALKVYNKLGFKTRQ